MQTQEQPIRAIILSGGGGRGGFHVGAYEFLAEMGWDPEIVIGTSIGAVNGALITEGYTPRDLRNFWLGSDDPTAPNLHEVNHIEGLSARMRPFSRWVTRQIMHYVLQDRLKLAQPGNSPEAHTGWKALPDIRVDEETNSSRKMHLVSFINRLFGDSVNLLDTGPLRETLRQALFLKDEKEWIGKDSEKILLINATNVRNGRHEIFSNRAIDGMDLPEQSFFSSKDEVQHGIRLDHIMASASIPGVYPWTRIKGEYYWDGAIVNNTPIGAVIDAAHALDPTGKRPLEVVCVLLSPWHDPLEGNQAFNELPMNFMDTINFSLDWMLLSSFREQLKLFTMMQEMGKAMHAAGGETPELLRWREIKFLVTAPDPRKVYPGNSYPMWRIIDYDRSLTEKLIDHGYERTKSAYEKGFR